MRRPFALLLGLTFALLPGVSHGHAIPVSEEPTNGIFVPLAPSTIRIRFSERLEPSASGMKLLIPGTSTPQKLETRISPSDPRALEGITSSTETQGAYTVYWNVVSSDDGHFTRGAFSFAVGTTSELALNPSYVETIRRSSGLESASVFLEFLGQALLLGLLLLKVQRKSQTITVLAFGFVLIGIVGYATSLGITLAEYENIPFKNSIFKLLQTNTGILALLRITTSILVFVSIARFPRTSALFLGITIVLRASASHAAASTTLTLFSVAINSLHLFAKEAWVGTVLLFSLHPSLWATYKEQRKRTALFLAIGGVTGAYIVWLHLKDVLNTQHTEWGSWFALLLLCSMAFLGAHLLGARRAQTQLLYGEAILGSIVLFLSAMLATTTPPTAPHAPTIDTQTSNGITITLKERTDAQNDYVVILTGETEGAKEPFITLENSTTSDEPTPLALERVSEYGYAFKKALTGTSEGKRLRVQVPQEKNYDASAVFTLSSSETHTTTTRTKTLTIAVIITSIAIIALAFALYRTASKTNYELLPGEPPYGALTALTLTILFANAQLLPSSFQKQCLKDGNYWHFSAPVRRGVALPSVARNGCAFGYGIGLFHFNDEDEYRFFSRPAETKVSLSVSPESPKPGDNVSLLITVTDETGQPAEELTGLHNSLLTVSVIPPNMDSITHLYLDAGERSESNRAKPFIARLPFMDPGRYFILASGSHRTTPFSHSFVLDVGAKQAMADKSTHESRTAKQDGYKVALLRPQKIQSGEKTPLLFKIELNNEGVTNLQPTGDTLIAVHSLRDDGSMSTYSAGKPPSGGHSHSVKKEQAGPYVVVPAHFPEPGTYVHFVEFKHRGIPRTVVLKTQVLP